MLTLITFLTLTTSSVWACPDLSGFYEAGRRSGKILVDQWDQLACNQLTRGRLIIKAGKVTERYEDLAKYYNSKEPTLCRESRCQYFEELPQGIKLNYMGMIEIEGNYACAFEAVIYSLTPTRDLKLTYLLAPSLAGDPCSEQTTHSKELPRIIVP